MPSSGTPRNFMTDGEGSGFYLCQVMRQFCLFLFNKNLGSEERSFLCVKGFRRKEEKLIILK